MRNVEILKTQLKMLVDDVNSSLGYSKLTFHQQPVSKIKMSVTGGNGRLCIYPTSNGYKIGLSGIPLTNEMYGFMCKLTGKNKHDTYIFPAKKKLPMWIVDDFSLIKKAVQQYAKTTNNPNIKNIEKKATTNQVSIDIQEIIESPNVENTEKTSLIQSRVGQGKFRESLVSLWGSCSVTGYKQIPLLVASHIKPWSKSNNQERLDPYNGFLLLPNMDKVFDLGFISFNEAGDILISSLLPEYKILGISKGMQIKIKQKNKEYLEYHRLHVFHNT